MSDRLIGALLGHDPAALTEDVSLATAFTPAPITGRDAVVAALAAYGQAIGARNADLRLTGEQRDGAMFTTSVDGRTAQVLALATRHADGLLASIDLYGRPWPYMALIQQRLAQLAPDLEDPSLGTTPFVPEVRSTSGIEPAAVPPFAGDVTLFSPFLTAEPTGKSVVEQIMAAASKCYREPKFRAVLDVEGQPAFALVLDEIVEGNILQVAEIFTLNPEGEVDELRIFTRPWPLTAYFRRAAYRLLKDILGPEFWQGPDPESPLPIPSGHR